MLTLIFQFCFIFLVSYAAISDYQRLKIPNWVSSSLCAAFLLYAGFFLTGSQFLGHVAAGATLFAIAIIFYALGMFGGGDAKLLGAIALWAGPHQIYELAFLTGIIGGAMGMMLLGLRGLLRQRPALCGPVPLDRIVVWARDGVCPYGLAIGSAALICMPKMFA
jgi:prepilin peptidase CpaA